MQPARKPWVALFTRLATRRPRWTLAAVGAVTIVSVALAERLELRMNWVDLLPESNPDVRRYEDILDRFGEPSIVLALEGERDAIVAMAAELTPRLDEVEGLRNVVGRLPMEFFLDHGFTLLKPEQFDRSLEALEDWTLVGTLRGINDDYEREYTSSESNLRRDEVEIARSLLGMTRALELLSDGVATGAGPEAMAEAADALAVGEPWMLSLDRRMLLISCTPQASWGELDYAMDTLDEVRVITTEVAARHPDVVVGYTGIVKIGEDEMESVGLYTLYLSLFALALIYLLLSRTFNSWIMPLLALVPLVVGILWTQGLLYLLYGGLNIITAMMMLVLLGLGVDFSIHVIARFQEETARGAALEDAIAEMFTGTGTAVVIGALTTALAFLTLMVGETRGIHEFGAAAGMGVLLTLLAIFLALPAFLVLRHRRLERLGALANPGDRVPASASGLARESYHWIGSLAATGWRRPGLFLAVSVVVVGACAWAMRHTEWEYDFLELEAKGLRSVELQREIPDRFGVSDHGAFLVTESVEESRRLKEEFRDLPAVGEVYAISDYVPSTARLADYAPKLEAYRAEVLRRTRTPWRDDDAIALAVEIERLWDNLDLMSNLAYAAGLDRIVGVIDRMTGVDTETGDTDPRALLPTLSRRLEPGIDAARLRPLAEAWAVRMKRNLDRMTNPAPVSLDQVPGNMLRMFTPKRGEGYLLHLVPRRYIWDRESLEHFATQTEAIDSDVIGTEKLILIMNDATLADGRAAALLALSVIAVLLLFHFRGPVGLLALIPLVVGSLAMLGLMYAFGMTYNYVNLIAVPIILGIGIDDGVHALHRWREQRGDGPERISVSYRFVGKAILLTSLTTMIGFGSVAFYKMQGMASFGRVLFMGVGACFVATVLVLPPVLRVVYERAASTGETATNGRPGRSPIPRDE